MSNADRKNTSKTNAVIPAAPGQLQLFGRPLMLQGENAATYDELFADIRAAVKPGDAVDEMLLADAVTEQWWVLRWRRQKSTLLRVCQREALERFLKAELDYDLYADDFADDLTRTLEDNLPENQAGIAERLARACAWNNRDADAKENVAEILEYAGLPDMTEMLNSARARKAEELAQNYVACEPDAVAVVNKIFDRANKNIEDLMADQLTTILDEIDRIDRLATVAESRRNANLREIDRRRAVLGEALRRRVQEVEDAEFQVVEQRVAKGNRDVTSDSKVQANRANARASTGPKTAQGRVRAARNALSHGLSLPLYANPTLSKEVEVLADEIAGAGQRRNPPIGLPH